ncbi:MAG TPA: ABC transporter permease [Candidatus Cybelea sp.]|jgi:predicted permease|nr:ABC transporter permease [Candidatus Cybelea sp.]
MTFWSRLRSWRRVILDRSRLENDMDAELRFHVEAFARDLVGNGMERQEAMRRARLEFGGIERTKEECRDARGANLLESWSQDLGYGLRMLRKNPGSTAAVVLALALGIGLNTTVFSFVNALLLRPPTGVEAPDKLLQLWLHNRGTSGIEGYLPVTYPDYVYYRDHNQSFTGMLAFDGDPESVIWNRSGEGQVVLGQLVSGNFFSLLGVHASLGRTFLPEDDQPRNPRPVVVLGHSFWQQHLGSDPQVVGKSLLLNGTSFTVIGVAPGRFSGLLVAIEPDFWAPLTAAEQILHDAGRLTDRHGYWLFAVGRLKPGVDAPRAGSEVNLLALLIEQEHPDTNKNLGASVFPATLVPGPYRGYVSAFTGLLMAVFGLVLVIACVNAATLLLARATGRAREMAIRSALGAGRARLIRQMLVESTLLSGLAGCLGVLFAYWVSPLLLALKPASLPITLRVPLDWRVLLFTSLVSLSTGIVFGLTPALRSAKVQVAPILKDEVQSASYRKSRLRSVLMIGEIATCMVLLVGAALCVGSLLNANSIDPGFDTKHVAVATLDPGSLGYPEAKVRGFYEQLSRQISALPGVSSASFVNHLPLGTAREQGAAIEGNHSVAGQNGVAVDVLRVAPGYFETMGISLLRGRDFLPRESRAPGEASGGVAIINDAMARKLWSGQDPVGRRITLGEDTGLGLEIIGVVKTGKYRTLGEEPIPLVYLPRLPGRRTLVVRTSGDPRFLLDPIRREIQAVDAGIAATDLETIEQYMALPLFPARTIGLLLGVSGILALMLTSIGLCGVISYIVSQRTHEIGLRMALGASQQEVLKLVVGHGLTMASIGLALGLAATLGLTRFLSSLLYGIQPGDPATLLGVSVGLIFIASLACYLPARRALSIDPIVALRYE